MLLSERLEASGNCHKMSPTVKITLIRIILRPVFVSYVLTVELFHVIASVCVARTYIFVVLISSRCVWLFVPVLGAVEGRRRGGFLRQLRPAFPSLLGILGHVGSQLFVMNAHGLNSFVLHFCSLCGAGRDPAPT